MSVLGPPLQTAVEQLALGGLNRMGVVDIAAYDAGAREGLRSTDLAPWARSILVFASGGSVLWEGLVAAIRSDHGRLTHEPHPLDRHVDRMVQDLVLEGVEHRWFLATEMAEVQLDFRSLGLLAGIGSVSRLGLLIEPQFGLWMGLRAACFVDRVLMPSEPGEDICDGCDAPCIAACPAGALSSGQWEVQTCASYHRTSTDCAQTCHSREACPVGTAHRYSDLQRVYHYDRLRGRRALRSSLQISSDQDLHEGSGPHWEDWDGS